MNLKLLPKAISQAAATNAILYWMPLYLRNITDESLLDIVQ